MRKRSILVTIIGMLSFFLMLAGCTETAHAAAGDGDRINDSYNPDAYAYYYQQLNDLEKAIYNKLMTTAEGACDVEFPKTEFGSDLTSFSTAYDRALIAISNDHPIFRMYWSSGSGVEEKEDFYLITLTENSAKTSYLLDKCNYKLNSIVNRVDADADMYTKVREMTTILWTETQYDWMGAMDYASGTETRAVLDHCAIGLLAYDTAVCEGYADAAKIICDELGITCISVGNAGHGWNYIQMEDGAWYGIDFSAVRPIENESAENVKDFILLGSSDPVYTGESNYWLSEVYLGQPGMFSFPVLSNTTYVYTGDYSYRYSPDTSYPEPEGRFRYTDNGDGTCTIIGYEGDASGDLIIPSAIDDLTVTKIGESAFYHCEFPGSIIIADTVREIGDGAFESMKKAQGTIAFPAQLERIGRFAFAECYSLSGNLNFPDTLKIIDEQAFYRCRSLSGDIIFPEGIETVTGAFNGCQNLDGTFYLPNSLEWDFRMIADTVVSSIAVNDDNPNYMTYMGLLYNKQGTVLVRCPPGYTGEITILDSVEEIEPFAVSKCPKVSGELHLPSSLKTIGRNAFVETHFTGDLTIPDSTESIGGAAFMYCGFGGKLTIGSGLNKIENSTFSDCVFTGGLELPEGIREIGEWAFKGCQMGGFCHLPTTLEKIGEFAFSQCNFEGELTIPENVAVESNAFLNNYFSYYSCHCGYEYEQSEASSWSTRIYCPFCGGGYYVSNYIGNISFSSSHVFLPCAEKDAYSLMMYDSDGEWVYPGYFNWSTEDAEIANVDNYGRVTAVSEGATVITATEKYRAFTLSCHVCVYNSDDSDGNNLYARARAATCTETGNIEYWHCMICDKYFSDAEAKNEVGPEAITTPPEGHIWNSALYLWAFDEGKVTGIRACGRDSSHTEMETVNAHRFATVSPTKTDAGEYKWVSDAFENDAFSVQEVEGGAILSLATASDLTLPSSLTTIETEAFAGVASDVIIVPDSCTTIEPGAFSNCENLRYIRLPADVEIPDDAFTGCPNVVIDQR